MRGEGVIRMACLRWGSGHRSAQVVPRPPDVRYGGHVTGHCGEDLPRDPLAQGLGQVARGVLQETSITQPQNLPQTPQSR